MYTVYSDVEMTSFRNYDVHEDQESIGNVNFYCMHPERMAEKFVEQAKQVAQVQMALNSEKELLDIYRGILLGANGLEDKMIIGDLLFEQDDDGPGKLTMVKRYEG